ncbi:MAG: hypothetical protein ACM3RP_13820 [Chitinophagales bacterium]
MSKTYELVRGFFEKADRSCRRVGEHTLEVLRHLYLSADVHFPKLMKMIWGDWKEERGEADVPPVGRVGDDVSEDLPF